MDALPEHATSTASPNSGKLRWLSRARSLRRISRGITPERFPRPHEFHPAYAAIILGAVMNILDASSIGLLVFPADGTMFHGLESQSIAMFLAATVLNEMVFVCGGTNFVQSQGEMLVEVLPFMQNIATKLATIITDNRDALLATIVASYVLSSIVLGALLLALGFFQIDRWIAYFPQAVLDGALGAIGLSLFISGFEVAQRSTFEWSTQYFRTLFTSNSMPVVVCAISLTFLLCIGVRIRRVESSSRPMWNASWTRRFIWEVRRMCSSSFFTPAFVLGSGIIFWIAALASKRSLPDLVEHHWLFMETPKGMSFGERMRFYEFWSLFNFNIVRWDAMHKVMVEIIVLIVIGALNLPIYYPTLRNNLPDVPRNASIKKEFIGHGIANLITGFCGTLPCLVVMSNTLFFSRAGGKRFDSVCVMFLTFLFFIFSKLLLPYIPVLSAAHMVFFFGLELMAEALIPTWSNKPLLEYMVIVGTMIACTALGFAQGVGIGLAATLAVLGFEHLADYEIRTCFVPLTMLADSQVLSRRIIDRLADEPNDKLHIGVISVAGTAGYTASTKLKQAIHTVQQRGCSALVIDLTYTVRIDRVAASAIQDERSNPQGGAMHPPGFLLGVPYGSPRYDIMVQVGSVCANPSQLDNIAANEQMMHSLWPMAEFTDVLSWISSRASVSHPRLPRWARNSFSNSDECSVSTARSASAIPMTPMTFSFNLTPSIDPELPDASQWHACWDQLCCLSLPDEDAVWLTPEKRRDNTDTTSISGFIVEKIMPVWRESFISVLEQYGRIRFHEPHTLLANASDPLSDVRIVVVGALVKQRHVKVASSPEISDAWSPASKVDRSPADWIKARHRFLRRRSTEPVTDSNVQTITEHFSQGDIIGLSEIMFGEAWSSDLLTAGQLVNLHITIDFAAHDVRTNTELATALNAFYSHNQFRMHRLQDLYNRALSQGERYKW